MDELIKRLQARSIEDGECWIWTGHCQDNGTPMANWRSFTGRRGPMNVRRIIAKVRGDVLKNRVCTAKCGTTGCVNPAHIVSITKSKSQKMHADSWKRSGVARMKHAEITRARLSKLTWPIVREIRANQESSGDLAKRYGVTPESINRVRRYASWRPANNPYMQLMG